MAYICSWSVPWRLVVSAQLSTKLLKPTCRSPRACRVLSRSRLLLTLLAGIAEFERELIRARTGDGRRRAKQRGVRFGRPPKLTPHQRQEALARLQSGETQTDIARSYNVDPTTIGRLQSFTALG
jgi:DNA invertase Pin-like site-specific DNA recombinase